MNEFIEFLIEKQPAEFTITVANGIVNVYPKDTNIPATSFIVSE